MARIKPLMKKSHPVMFAECTSNTWNGCFLVAALTFPHLGQLRFPELCLFAECFWVSLHKPHTVACWNFGPFLLAELWLGQAFRPTYSHTLFKLWRQTFYGTTFRIFWWQSQNTDCVVFPASISWMTSWDVTLLLPHYFLMIPCLL